MASPKQHAKTNKVRGGGWRARRLSYPVTCTVRVYEQGHGPGRGVKVRRPGVRKQKLSEGSVQL